MAADSNTPIGGCPPGDAAGTDQITFAASTNGTPIVLGLGMLTFGSNLKLSGNGATQTIIDGNHATMGIKVNAGSIAEIAALTLRNCRGVPNTIVPGGGGIFNDGTLTISNSALSDNVASDTAGGIWNDNVLTVVNSIFTGNKTSSGSGFGGGIFNAGVLTVEGSTFSDSFAGAGAAIL